MRMLERTSRRTFLEEMFVQNAESFWRTSSTLTFPLCDVPVTCLTVLILEFYSNMHGFDFSIPFFSTCVRGTRIEVTPQLVADVLYVPRVEHLDYSSCERLRTVSKDEMISAFCERPANWGDRQFTPCKAFAKGLRFMNMVMTFVLHPFSHYNSITEPCA